MECKICHKEMKSALSMCTHLTKSHAMTPKEYFDKYVKNDGDDVCKQCGKPTTFKGFGKGYNKFCSRKCSAVYIKEHPEINAAKYEAYKKTMMATYGVSNCAELESVKESRKKTMNERYGVDFYSQASDFADKTKKTNLERYGKTSYIATEAFQEKLRASNMERIGVPYNFCKRTESATENYKEILSKCGCTLISFDNKKSITYKCDSCGAICTEQDLFVKSRIALGVTACSICIKKDDNVSIAENQLREFVESLGVKTTHYGRNFLGKYGADIVSEDHKIIIEYDGVHWHSELYKPDDYHLEKTETGIKMGYRVIHVFSDEWLFKQDIVKSRIRNAFGLNTSHRIFARKCSVVKVEDTDARKFLTENHIQGYCACSDRYGLMYEGELVAVMTFGKSRFENDVTELLRFCTKIDVSVPGGAGRLFSAFVNEHKDIDFIVSYADRRWSSQNAFYNKIGFSFARTTPPNYHYVENERRVNRMEYQKAKLVAEGADPNKSERQIMEERGIYRIYDCGNDRFEWHRH